MRRAFILLPLVLAAAAGCHVRNQLYNPVPRSIVLVAPEAQEIPQEIAHLNPTSVVSPVCVARTGKPCLGFVEFDEMGEYWDPGQITETIKMIERSASANAAEPPPLVLLFVHGWKNNAADGWSDITPPPTSGFPYRYRPQKKSGNVLGFEGVLEYLAKDVPQYNTRPIIGVYFGWRGDFTNRAWPVSRQFSYFGRERTAIRIPGADMTEALTKLMLGTRQARQDATIVLIGHSFGALVLERAITQAMTDYLLRIATGADPMASPNTARADLIVFVNSAASASEGKQMMDVLKRAQAQNAGGLPKDRPLFLSISSIGDLATRFALSFGHGPSFLGFDSGGSFRTYDPPDPAGITHQRDYYLHTTAHMDALKSHFLVEAKPDDKCTGAPILKDGIVLFNKITYRLCENPAPHFNDTPYWALQMPASIVHDHSGIFNLNFVDLIFRHFQPASMR